MALTRADVVRVADLARLRLTNDEIDGMQVQLSRILEHVSALQAVDVNRASLGRDAALANSADTQQGMFRVKAVFEEQ